VGDFSINLTNVDQADNAEINERQPVRERRAPDRFGEWVTIASKDVLEPTTINEALCGPNAERWHEAMQQEIDSLQGNSQNCRKIGKQLGVNGYLK
jgi:hypothetical protein